MRAVLAFSASKATLMRLASLGVRRVSHPRTTLADLVSISIEEIGAASKGHSPTMANRGSERE
jgi:hypothetical protein